MTFYDAINTFLKKSNIKLDYPIPVVIGYENSKYIDIELYGTNKKIDEILNHEIIINDDFSILWKDEENYLYFESENNIMKFKNKNGDETVENALKSKSLTHIGLTKDNKFNIYLLLRNESNSEEEIKYPNFNSFQYKNLYSYQNEDTFIHAIYIEFMVRNAEYNNLLFDTIEIKENIFDGETEYEYEIRTYLLLEEKQKQIDEILVQNYGLNFYELNELNLTIFKMDDDVFQDDMSIEINCSEPSYKSIIDLRLPEKEYLASVKKLKNEYEKNKNNFFPLENKINKQFVKEANNIINKFPISFKKKQDQLIKSLFIFDCIQTYNKSMDELNIPIKNEYETKKIEINNEYLKKQEKVRKEIEEFEVYKKEATDFEEKIRTERKNTYQKAIDELEKSIKILEKKEKKELREITNQFKKNLMHHTKMDPSKYNNSIFNEIAPIIDEKPKQCTKIHSFIHKFLQKQITN